MPARRRRRAVRTLRAADVTAGAAALTAVLEKDDREPATGPRRRDAIGEEVERLFRELVDQGKRAERWDLAGPERRERPTHGFDAAEARAAIAAMPFGREWVQFAVLEGGDWCHPLCDDHDPAGHCECERSMVWCVVAWLVALRRREQQRQGTAPTTRRGPRDKRRGTAP